MAVRAGGDRGVLLAGEAEDSMVRGVAPPTKDNAPPHAMKRAGGRGKGREKPVLLFSHDCHLQKWQFQADQPITWKRSANCKGLDKLFAKILEFHIENE